LATRTNESPLPLSLEATPCLIEIGRALSDEPDLSVAIERVANLMRSIISWDRLVITSIDVEAGTLVDAYIAGARSQAEQRRMSGPLQVPQSIIPTL